MRILAVAFVLGAGVLAAVPAWSADDGAVAAIGRVLQIKVEHSYLLVEFPTGQQIISVNHRELTHYRLGDLVAVDWAGRPLGPGAEP